MELNGQRKEIGTPIFLQGGRTQVPLRFITELLGWDVKWYESDWSITLTKLMTTMVEMGHSH
ncbi:stalk domain-containing protein [Paenibacillus sp. 2RAB27]|uniref:stalk domain-containing protein n=1 Tax=Paenibacillus sp. 2RAB27 TaxID=3232991 RepID=UPI003F9A1B3E